MGTSGLDGKAWLITGGAGFFGGRLAELLLARRRPSKIVIFSRDELKQHELRERLPADPRIVYLIGDVRDRERLFQACREIDWVIHAAALKQVGACEENPLEAVKTNVLGSANVIDAAIEHGAAGVLAISTDKAVDPAGLYGATKLCSEKLFVAANRLAGVATRFGCVRCGNIAGSPASVIPAFARQRERGRIMVRDPRMTRFYFSLDRASEFVLSSLGRLRGGEIFVPKMPSMRIVDLAEAMAPGCPIETSGVRPGEKIHESLLSRHELWRTLEFPDGFVVYPAAPSVGAGGRPLPEDFSHDSDSNSEFLEPGALAELLGGRFGDSGTGRAATGCKAPVSAVPTGSGEP